MKLNYTISFADFKAAQRLHRHQKLGRRISFILLYVAVPVLAVLGWFCWPLPSSTPAAVSLGLGILEVVLVWFAISLPISRIYETRKGFKRLFAPTRMDRSNFVEIDDERIFYATPGISETKFSWNAVVEFAQDEKVTLLYVSKRAFITMPTPDFSPEQRAELNALLARHLPKGEK